MIDKNKENADVQQVSFETAFKRLEELLEKLNSAETPLEDALQYYEEADKLINLCNRRLNDAERRIEKLIKNRNDDVLMDDRGQPKTEPFSTS